MTIKLISTSVTTKQLHIFRMDMLGMGGESDGGGGHKGLKGGDGGSGKNVVGTFSMASCSSKVK